MVCALTVRQLEPGTFEQFRKTFMSFDDENNPPEGWVRFNMIRNVENPDEVVCFGFFDGTVEALRASAERDGYADQVAAIAPFVAGVGADGLYEIVEEFTAQPA